jgi:hypothetical protein
LKRLSGQARLKATAYHEAGHTIALWRLEGRVPRRVTIEPDKESWGAMFDPKALSGIVGLEYGDLTPRVQRRIENRMTISLAGPAAQHKYNPQSVLLHHGKWDRENVCALLSYLCVSNDVFRAYYRLMNVRAHQLIQAPLNWRAITILSRELIQQRTLEGEVLRKIVVSDCFALSSPQLRAPRLP